MRKGLWRRRRKRRKGEMMVRGEERRGGRGGGEREGVGVLESVWVWVGVVVF